MFGQGGFLVHKDTVAQITLFAKVVMPRLRELKPESRKTAAAAEQGRRSRECRMADTEIITVIDLGPYLPGTPGAIERTAGELRFALTEIGFYFIVNHGVPLAQIRDVFRQVAGFH